MLPPNQYDFFVNQPSPTNVSPNTGTRVSPYALGIYGTVNSRKGMSDFIQSIFYNPLFPIVVLGIGVFIATKLGED